MKSIKIDYFVSLGNKAIDVFKVFIIPDSHILWFEAFLMNGQFTQTSFSEKTTRISLTKLCYTHKIKI